MLIDVFGWSLLAFLFWLIYFIFKKTWKDNYKRKYKDVIVKDKKDADYWYGKKGEEFSSEVKTEIYKRDKGICQHSKRKTKNAPVGIWQTLLYFASYIPGLGILWRDWLCEIDHLVFKSFGGKGTKENGRCLARRFNRRRSNKPDKAFFEALRTNNEKVYLNNYRRRQ